MDFVIANSSSISLRISTLSCSIPLIIVIIALLVIGFNTITRSLAYSLSGRNRGRNPPPVNIVAFRSQNHPGCYVLADTGNNYSYYHNMRGLFRPRITVVNWRQDTETVFINGVPYFGVVWKENAISPLNFNALEIPVYPAIWERLYGINPVVHSGGSPIVYYLDSRSTPAVAVVAHLPIIRSRI